MGLLNFFMKSIILCFVIALSQPALSQTGNSILDSDSDMAIFYYNQGINKIELEDYEAALLDFNEAIKLNAKDADFYANRGYVKGELDDFIGAIEDYTIGILLDPNDHIGYNNRAKLKFYDEDNKVAMKDGLTWCKSTYTA